MAIRTKANKYKESSKITSGMTSQTKPVNGNRDVINTKVKLASFGADSVTKGVYSSHFQTNRPINDTTSHLKHMKVNKIA